jgi:phosphoserine phosphatase RsbU/P
VSSGTSGLPGWDLWLYSEPANDVGGDLVDHMRIDGHRHGVALGDVAGKALPAALLMVKLQATLRALAPLFDTLGDLGSALQRDGPSNPFAALVYLVLTERSGDVRVLNGGHMPPVVVRAGALDRLPPGSMVIVG